MGPHPGFVYLHRDITRQISYLCFNFLLYKSVWYTVEVKITCTRYKGFKEKYVVTEPVFISFYEVEDETQPLPSLYCSHGDSSCG